jgi:hypothetical protein
MEDVTRSVFHMLVLTSLISGQLMRPTPGTKRTSLLLLLAAGIPLLTRIYLPISASAAEALSLACGACYLAFFVLVVRKWVRVMNEAARE